MNSSVQPREVPWKDLLPLTKRQIANELLLSAPWLATSLYFYAQAALIPALFCSFYFFLTGLRQSHGAQHFTLGIPRRAHHLFLSLLSLLMLASMHAVQTSHLNHHRHCLEEADHEGSVARLDAWSALLAGPLFIVQLHRSAWKLASAENRRWIALELLSILAAIIFACTPSCPAPIAWHFSAMLLGECFTAFFAVWTVHHHCADPAGRTQRGVWLSRITYNMFYHREHHLFPQVPTPHLHLLAGRLDQCQPPNPQVLPTPGPFLSSL